MGLDNVASSHESIGAGSDFAKSTQTNDHSNPQQGTGATKTPIEERRDYARQNRKDRNSVTTKSSAGTQDNHSGDRRKLFVGGLPTDITDPEFRNFFSQFGELQESIVMFDRETRRSRGFGFVTYVNPDVAKSLLQMGNRGDGIGRLIMRGKTCEVKAAAPKGQAPNRGGKANRSNRGGPRNQHQAQGHQISSLGYNGQYPIMYQNESYHMPYQQILYPTPPGVAGYAPHVYNHVMPAQSHNQPHVAPYGSHMNTDSDLSGVVIAGAPNFYTPSSTASQPDRFSMPNALPPTPQITGTFQQPGYAFVPFVPDHSQMSFPVTEMGSMEQPIEHHVQDIEEMNKNDKGMVEIEKE